MAGILIHGENGSTFLQRLMYSEMLEVTFINAGNIEVTLRIPAVLVCEFSKRFEELCTMKHTFTAEEVLSTDQSQFSYYSFGHLERLLEVFVAWLYTSSLDYIDNYPVYNCLLSYADLWFFGHTIGAPKFQDAILVDLCSRSASASTSILEDISTNGDFYPLFYCAQSIWKQADFSIDYSKGYKDNEVYFENKKFLLFFLDVLAYEGISDSDVCAVIRQGGPLAVQLMKRIEMIAKSPRDGQPPWHESNIGKYLITKSEAQAEDQTLQEEFGSKFLEESFDKELEAPTVSRRFEARGTSRDPLQLASNDFLGQISSSAVSNSNTVINNLAKLTKSTSAVSHEGNFKESRGTKRKRPEISGVAVLSSALHQTASQINPRPTAFNSIAQLPLPKQPQSNTIIKNEYEGGLVQKYESTRSNPFSEASINFHAMANAQAQLLRGRSTSSETLRASSVGPAALELFGGRK